MIGGIVVQVIPSGRSSSLVEVLDELSFTRCWRMVNTAQMKEGDTLWWQQHIGIWSREGEFSDRKLSMCKPAAYRKDR